MIKYRTRQILTFSDRVNYLGRLLITRIVGVYLVVVKPPLIVFAAAGLAAVGFAVVVDLAVCIRLRSRVSRLFWTGNDGHGLTGMVVVQITAINVIILVSHGYSMVAIFKHNNLNEQVDRNKQKILYFSSSM